jgi:protease IV
VAVAKTSRRFGIFGSFVRGTWWGIKGFMVLVLTVLFYIVLIGLIGAIGSSSSPSVPKSGALVISPSGLLVEQLTELDPFSPASFLGGSPKEVLVSDVVAAIDHAASDERIKTLVLRLDSLAIPTFYASKSYKIAEAVDRFKESEKEVISIGNFYSQGGYLISAHADEIWMHPYGSALIEGYERRGTYYKTLLDNLMVTFHPFKVGEFKSAIEPQTRDDMSEPAKEASRALLGDMWSAYTSDVEAQRGFEPGTVQRATDNFAEDVRAASGDLAVAALNTGIVDKLMAFDQWRDALIEKVGEDKATNSFNQIDMRGYLLATANARAKARAKDTGNKSVVVITAKGSIVGGEAPRGTIGGDTLARIIRKARDNKTTKAIVLRVDSGGGSAFASEVIRRELVAAQEQGIPVVASMGSIAASGGYWISASADEIWAEPTTVTGSIGVIAALMTFEKLGDWAGIHGDGVGTTNLAGAGDPWRPLNPQFAEIIQLSIENTYDRFVALVVDHRGLDEEHVRKIAEGRVWSAPDALEIGLVDSLGGLDDAIAAAAKRAGLEDYNVDYLEKEVSPFDQFMSEFADSVEANLGLSESQTAQPSLAVKLAGDIARDLTPYLEMNDPNHVYLICEYCEVR